MNDRQLLMSSSSLSTTKVLSKEKVPQVVNVSILVDLLSTRFNTRSNSLLNPNFCQVKMSLLIYIQIFTLRWYRIKRWLQLSYSMTSLIISSKLNRLPFTTLGRLVGSFYQWLFNDRDSLLFKKLYVFKSTKIFYLTFTRIFGMQFVYQEKSLHLDSKLSYIFSSFLNSDHLIFSGFQSDARMLSQNFLRVGRLLGSTGCQPLLG